MGALLLAPTAYGAAAVAPDPVVQSIGTALAAGRISPDDARELRLTWTASARAARTARTSSRRASIVAVRAYTTNLARARGLTPERLKPALLSVEATTWTMLKASDFPSHEEEVEIPGEVVMFTYYSGRGVQFQPFETYKQGLRELNTLKPDVEAARAIADRMLELAAPRGPALTWEYFFPFGGPSRPWTSAISQAIATEFFYRVGAALPEAERAPYTAAAEAAARSFELSTKQGGVASPQGTGSFYVMYPFAPSQRILNGHLQVLLNVNRYANASGSTVARTIVDRGIVAVLPLLPKFDTGAWSNYQPGQEAELGYHEFQTEQLVKLGEETGNATFADYGARFTQYLETPPTITFPTTQIPSIFAARDGFRDSLSIPFTIDKRSKVTIVIFDATAREVRRVSTTRGRGPGAIVWDGLDGRGTPVPPGDYRAEATVTDVVANRSFVSLGQSLRVAKDVLPPVLRLLTVRERGTTTIVTANGFDVSSGYLTAMVRVDGRVLATMRAPRAGNVTLRVARPMSEVSRGELVLRDTSGNELVQALTS
ncbi:MAG: D-glucuronyl C5-epimerase domain protein [Thermoleophilia bacterium]|nr:D-glucuronyl C5-epimerase domain protein [Thermoleophilia bacterium]